MKDYLIAISLCFGMLFLSCTNDDSFTNDQTAIDSIGQEIDSAATVFNDTAYWQTDTAWVGIDSIYFPTDTVAAINDTIIFSKPISIP